MQSNIFKVILLMAALFPWFLHAQLTLATVATPALNDPADALLFRAEAPSGTWIQYQIKLADRSESMSIAQGQVQAQNGVAWITFQPLFPCFVVCQVTSNGGTAQAAGVFKPYQISASEPEPMDFDDFWQAQSALARQQPLDVQIQEQSQQPYHRSYKINFALPDNRRCYGYLCVPNGAGPFPAIIELPAYGYLPNIVQAPNAMAERGGAIGLSLNIHNNDPEQAGPSDYVLQGASDPATNYYKYAVLSVVRAIDYLETRNDYNRQVGLLGVSQGGGLSLLAAGVDARVSVLVNLFAAMSDHSAGLYGKPAGFPYYYNGGGQALFPAVKYYDAAFAAARFKGASYTVIAYEDEICPPASTMAAFNALGGEKNLLHLLKNKHNPLPEEGANPSHPNGIFAFLREQLPGMRTPPWPWGEKPRGYKIDVGKDTSLLQGESLDLQAFIHKNTVPKTDWPGLWTLVAGPGNANFSTPENMQNTVSFDQSGTYQIRFSAIDPEYQLENQGKYYSLSDQLCITVQPNTDQDAPVPLISSDLTYIQDTFWIKIDFNEPVTGLEISDFDTLRCKLLQLTGSGTSYQAQVKPIIKGPNSIWLKEAACTDLSGNDSLVSNIFTLVYYPKITIFKG
jgi:cephalosporin-C deacetylase